MIDKKKQKRCYFPDPRRAGSRLYDTWIPSRGDFAAVGEEKFDKYFAPLLRAALQRVTLEIPL